MGILRDGDERLQLDLHLWPVFLRDCRVAHQVAVGDDDNGITWPSALRHRFGRAFARSDRGRAGGVAPLHGVGRVRKFDVWTVRDGVGSSVFGRPFSSLGSGGATAVVMIVQHPQTYLLSI